MLEDTNSLDAAHFPLFCYSFTVHLPPAVSNNHLDRFSETEFFDYFENHDYLQLSIFVWKRSVSYDSFDVCIQTCFRHLENHETDNYIVLSWK